MKKRKKLAKIGLISICIALGLFLVLFAGYSAIYAHKNYANQYIGGTNFGGKDKAKSKEILQTKTKEFLDQEIKLIYEEKEQKNKEYSIKPSDLGIQYNIDATLDNLWGFGRRESVFTSFWQQLQSIFRQNRQQAVYSINESSLNKKIEEIALALDSPEKDFSLLHQGGEFVLSTERKEGKRIDQDRIKKAINNQLSFISHKEIVFQTEIFKPQINEAKAKKRLDEANGILKAGEISLETDSQKFSADIDTIGSFIISEPKGDDIEIAFNEERIKIFVASLAGNINVEPQNAQLTISGGKATVFSTARLGKTLDQVQTVVDVENALAARLPDRATGTSPTIITLKVEIKRPEITDDAINSLGVVELVGTGTTNFKGSPSNRVHNITVGVKAINGSLIKPDEEFSTLKKLGTIDASTGYLPELVIKENRTIPEFGGGLCQVSTTLFRVALNSGLKVTERANHKYRVSYYEPPVGMDATIYDPAPDFKFINNYSSHILIQGRVEGTKVIFDMYGTKDGRKTEISTPEMYDIVEPGPAVMIETDTLPAGEKKLIERGHQGASAKFTYKVVRGTETLQEKIFVSKYVAWSEKWLVGKGASPVPVETPAPAPAVEPAPIPTPEPAPVPEPVVTPVVPPVTP